MASNVNTPYWAVRIARAYPDLSVEQCCFLARMVAAIERRQERHAERVCVGDGNPRTAKALDQALADWKAMLPNLGRGVTYKRVNDPRSFTLIVQFPNQGDC